VGQEFNVLALIKGEERYVYVYDDASRESLLETFQAHAADPQLTLNWFDAAVLTQKARQQAADSMLSATGETPIPPTGEAPVPSPDETTVPPRQRRF
jgi:hypothetical protein